MSQIRYHYESAFAPYIEGLIRQKKANGFIYDYEAYILKTFDHFCSENDYVNPLITRDIALKWAVQRKTEGINYRNQRVSILRQLSIYMNSVGINSYIPHLTPSEAVRIPHILSVEELRALFAVVDIYLPDGVTWQRFAMEYQLLFRLFYCCGLRLSEGCSLKKTDVNLEKGILTIRQSKGRKDRLVYMAHDLTALVKKYLQKITSLVPDTIWLFPGRTPEKHIPKTSIEQKFKQLWAMTPYAGKCDKEPTVQALRHTFVVNKMNEWMTDGISLEVMMPYLSRYLGHSWIKGTMYYYHQVSEAFRIVRQKDLASDRVIPEVIFYEE
jgi:integrase/recombinase XerD